MRTITLILSLCALPVSAQTALTAEQFEARVEGKTLDFGYNGETPYGLERYLPDRRVLWSWGDNTCEPGKWYENDGEICFVYEFDPTPQCWTYYDMDGRLMAVFMNDIDTATGTVVYELSPVARELICDNFGM